jgi:hypothetical protein
MTAAVNPTGTVTVLKWPNASFFDQIKYRTTDRKQPRMGALPNEGAFLGVAWRESGSTKWAFSWLRDLRAEQRYADDDSDEIVTTFSARAARLTITQRDLVAASEDALVRSIEVKRSAGSSVQRVRVITFANFNPVFSKSRNSPTQDWCVEEENDGGGRYVEKSDAIVHERSGTDESTGNPSSVAIAMGFASPSLGHQVGVDTFQTGGAGTSAFVDAKDGKLTGDDTATGQADAAISDEIAFGGKRTVTSTAFIAAGFNEKEALSALDRARSTSVAAFRAGKSRFWTDWLKDTVVPKDAPKPVIMLAKRALITARQNAALDLISASVATQEPEGLDWIRNGAYVNRMLDIAGHHEMVGAHNVRYAQLQATANKPPGGETTPSGNWSQNYYADGVVGGPISYEVDETGLGIWTLWDHYTFVHKRAYLLDVYGAIQRAAHYLSDNPPLGCRDPGTGLQCLASEGDSSNPSQTLVGAQAAWLGLDAAVAAAKIVGTDISLANAQKWGDRRDELGAAIKANFFDAGCKCYTTDDQVGGTNLWPVGFEPYGSKRSRSQADANWRRIARVVKDKETRGGYESMAILGNAYEWARRREHQRDLEKALMWVATKATTEATGSLGGAWMRFPKDRSPIVTMRSQPHAWAQAIFYLAALKTYGKEKWRP